MEDVKHVTQWVAADIIERFDKKIANSFVNPHNEEDLSIFELCLQDLREYVEYVEYKEQHNFCSSVRFKPTDNEENLQIYNIMRQRLIKNAEYFYRLGYYLQLNFKKYYCPLFAIRTMFSMLWYDSQIVDTNNDEKQQILLYKNKTAQQFYYFPPLYINHTRMHIQQKSDYYEHQYGDYNVADDKHVFSVYLKHSILY